MSGSMFVSSQGTGAGGPAWGYTAPPNKVAKASPSMSTHDLTLLISMLPEVEKLVELSERHLSYLHKDKCLDLYARFFTSVMEANGQIFEPMSIQRKAEVLFQCYTELAFTHLEQTLAFKDHHRIAMEAIKSIDIDPLIKKQILESFCKEKSRQNDVFISFALGRSLRIDPVLLSFCDVVVYDQLSSLVKTIQAQFDSFNRQLYSSHMREERLTLE